VLIVACDCTNPVTEALKRDVRAFRFLATLLVKYDVVERVSIIPLTASTLPSPFNTALKENSCDVWSGILVVKVVAGMDSPAEV